MRGTRVGVVTSDKCDKMVCVAVAYTMRHPKYGKYVRRRMVVHAHDERNEARVGDAVEVMACRPMSKTKSWRLVRIVARGSGELPPQAKESGSVRDAATANDG